MYNFKCIHFKNMTLSITMSNQPENICAYTLQFLKINYNDLTEACFDDTIYTDKDQFIRYIIKLLKLLSCPKHEFDDEYENLLGQNTTFNHIYNYPNKIKDLIDTLTPASQCKLTEYIYEDTVITLMIVCHHLNT
jgi:hypothetical protein